MATTISVSEATRRRLMRLKLEEEARSMDEVLERLLVHYRRSRYEQAARSFRQWMAEKGVTYQELTGKDPLE